MSKSSPVFARYSAYNVHRSDTFRRALQKDYDYLEEQHGVDYADSWADKLYSHLESLKSPDLEHASRLGTIDPKNYSKSYAYRHIPDTETTIFFKVEGDNIYLMTCGWSRLNWPDIFKEQQSELAKAYEKSKSVAAGHSHAANPVSNQTYENGRSYNPNNAGDVIRRLRPDLVGQQPEQQDKVDPDRNDRDDR